MVSIWYLIAQLTTGAKPVNETVCRGAFVLYILFINLASAHHLLVDPGVGAAWKIWNTSYAMYLAVLASMIHGFTVPAAVEVAMREKGYVKGLFGWVMSAPWRNPAFAGFVLSLLIFGFIGGITGVTLGTQQINIIAHNTLRITGHFHATVVGGTSLAFMALAYYVIPLMFRRDFIWRSAARLQPWLFGGGILLVSLGMSFAGSLGVPRRDYDIESAGIFGPSAHLFLAIMGVGAIVAVIGLLLFVVLCVGTILCGERNHGRPMADWGVAQAQAGTRPGSLADDHWAMKGTVALTAVFLASFAVYYFANWKALADVWPVR
jgi:cytochrome c oxidase subunit 1